MLLENLHPIATITLLAKGGSQFLLVDLLHPLLKLLDELLRFAKRFLGLPSIVFWTIPSFPLHKVFLLLVTPNPLVKNPLHLKHVIAILLRLLHNFHLLLLRSLLEGEFERSHRPPSSPWHIFNIGYFGLLNNFLYFALVHVLHLLNFLNFPNLLNFLNFLNFLHLLHPALPSTLALLEGSFHHSCLLHSVHVAVLENLPRTVASQVLHLDPDPHLLSSRFHLLVILVQLKRIGLKRNKLKFRSVQISNFKLTHQVVE